MSQSSKISGHQALTSAAALGGLGAMRASGLPIPPNGATLHIYDKDTGEQIAGLTGVSTLRLVHVPTQTGSVSSEMR